MSPTTPECDERTPQVSYEAANIRRWLLEHRTNPLTRAELKASMLKRNVALETKIKQFMESILNDTYFIEHRHEHPALQQAYDIKFGLVPKVFN